ncbi:MAG TPA: hypothetical protein VIB82_08155 [Caulobacteraceae bacterium]
MNRALGNVIGGVLATVAVILACVSALTGVGAAWLMKVRLS